jgi:hypothetical protein
VVADDPERRVLGLHAGLGLLQVADRRGGHAAPEQHPAQRVGRVRIVGQQRLRVLCEVERAIEVLARLAYRYARLFFDSARSGESLIASS